MGQRVLVRPSTVGTKHSVAAGNRGWPVPLDSGSTGG